MFALYKPCFVKTCCEANDPCARARVGLSVWEKKEEFCQYVKQVDVDADAGHLCTYVIDKQLFGTMKYILSVCAYVPPAGSPCYTHYDFENGIALLEEFLCDCVLANDDVYIILCGDLPSKTSNVSYDYHGNGSHFDLQYESHPLCASRNYEDKEFNEYEKMLLNMCTA